MFILKYQSKHRNHLVDCKVSGSRICLWSYRSIRTGTRSVESAPRESAGEPRKWASCAWRTAGYSPMRTKIAPTTRLLQIVHHLSFFCYTRYISELTMVSNITSSPASKQHLCSRPTRLNSTVLAFALWVNRYTLATKSIVENPKASLIQSHRHCTRLFPLPRHLHSPN